MDVENILESNPHSLVPRSIVRSTHVSTDPPLLIALHKEGMLMMTTLAVKSFSFLKELNPQPFQKTGGSFISKDSATFTSKHGVVILPCS